MPNSAAAGTVFLLSPAPFRMAKPMIETAAKEQSEIFLTALFSAFKGRFCQTFENQSLLPLNPEARK